MILTLDAFQSRKRESHQAEFFGWRRAILNFRQDDAHSVHPFMLQDLL